jgi:leucyl aminopeptidase
MPLSSYMRYRVESATIYIEDFGRVATGCNCSAALFLHEFNPDGQPWGRLDIAGPARADEEYELASYFGVRLLAELFASLSGSTEPASRNG